MPACSGTKLATWDAGVNDEEPAGPGCRAPGCKVAGGNWVRGLPVHKQVRETARGPHARVICTTVCSGHGSLSITRIRTRTPTNLGKHATPFLHFISRLLDETKEFCNQHLLMPAAPGLLWKPCVDLLLTPCHVPQGVYCKLHSPSPIWPPSIFSHLSLTQGWCQGAPSLPFSSC